MAQADNYEVKSAIGSTATVRVDFDWEFNDVSQLVVYIQNNTTAEIKYAETGDIDFTQLEDITGTYCEVENYWPGTEITAFVARETAKEQDYNAPDAQSLAPVKLTAALDYIMRTIQEIWVKVGAGIENAITSIQPFTIDGITTRAGKILGFDATGQPTYLTYGNQEINPSPWIPLSNYTDLNDALTSIGTDIVELLIDKPAPISGNTTIPENITLRSLPGNFISGPHTLTINGTISAGSYQIFGSDISLTVNNSTSFLKLSWFENFPLAITALATNPATLLIDISITLLSNATTPPTLTLNIPYGNTITTGAYTLTANGPILAGLYRIFDNTGGLVDGDIQNVAIYPQWFGAAGDGVTDDTDAINSCMLTGANVVEGSKREYIVTSLVMQTGKTLRNFSLKEAPSAVEISLVPVVRIGDDLVAVTDVTLENVIIDGNRQNLDNITFANGEDGGMHGIRVGGLCTDIRIINCQANYCGTAGLALHSEQFGPTADYSIKRVYVENFVAEWNREHGFFADSFDGFYINGGVFNNNGQDLVGGQPDTSGLSGAKVTGVEFGGGFDIESYVGFPSSYMKNFYGKDLVCKANAQAPQLYIPNPVTEVTEIPCENMNFIGCEFDKSTLGTNKYGFRFFANSPAAGKYGIDKVVMSGRLDGHIDANNTSGVAFTSGWIEADPSFAYKAIMNNSVSVNITVPSNRDNILIQTLSALGVVTDTGGGTWTPTVSQTILADGIQQLQIDGNISGGLISGGAMSFTLTMPTGINIVSGWVNAFNSTSAVSVVANVQVLTASTCRVYITPIDDTVSVQLRLNILI